ncbi:MAG: hypothetical protein ABDK78_04825 [Atribacterota bacterium]
MSNKKRVIGCLVNWLIGQLFHLVTCILTGKPGNWQTNIIGKLVNWRIGESVNWSINLFTISVN